MYYLLLRQSYNGGHHGVARPLNPNDKEASFMARRKDYLAGPVLSLLDGGQG